MATLTKIKIGYKSFIVPSSIKIDAIKELVNAIPIDSHYMNGKNRWIEIISDETPEISIVQIEDVVRIVNKTEEDNPFQIVINAVTERLQDKKHAPIVFRKNQYDIGATSYDIPDLGNPETKPEELVEEIVKLAISTPYKYKG